MAEFFPNKPITTTESSVEVSVSPEQPLPVGPVRFQLVVFDEADNASEPAFLEVVIRDSEKPTAVLDGPRSAVEYGSSFQLTGDRSSDLRPGRIARYEWTMVPILERPNSLDVSISGPVRSPGA
jgi:hypothetical protein